MIDNPFRGSVIIILKEMRSPRLVSRQPLLFGNRGFAFSLNGKAHRRSIQYQGDALQARLKGGVLGGKRA